MHNLIAFVFIKGDPNFEVTNLEEAIECIEDDIIDEVCGDRCDYDYGTTDIAEINERWGEYAEYKIEHTTIESEVGQAILKKLIDEYKKEKRENLKDIRKILETKSDDQILNDFNNTATMHTISTDYDCTIRNYQGETINNFKDLDKVLKSKGWVVFMDVHY